MKKHVLLILIFLFLVSNTLVVSLPRLPYPFGQEIVIDGNPASNLKIIIENVDTLDKTETYTNEKGQYLIDLANLPNGYSMGHKIKVVIFRENESRILKPIIIEREGGAFSKVDINWKDKTFKESEQCVDPTTMGKLLQKQKEEIIEE